MTIEYIHDEIIRTVNLEKRFVTGSVTVRALREVSLVIRQGEFVAIMGASGSGKSTLLNLLGCLDKPTGGVYLLEGTDISKLPKRELALIRNTRIGFVFQSYNLLARTTALENVELPLLYNAGIGAKTRREKAFHALERVGLSDRLHHKPSELSGGQQQRVAIARALVNDPALILADEPTGNLDTRTSYQVLEQFQALNDQGITLVMVTHEVDVARFTKRNVVFKDGVILSDTPVNQRMNALTELNALPEIN